MKIRNAVIAAGVSALLASGGFAWAAYTGQLNIIQWAGTVLGAPSNYGTSPGAVEVQGVNAFVTNAPAVTQSGTWTVQPGNTANTTAWKVDGSAVTQPTTTVDGGSVTLGAKADAKSPSTDTTPITAMQVLKEISAMAQAPAALPANQSTNVAQVNGHTTVEATTAGVQKVGIVGNAGAAVDAATGAAPPANIIYSGANESGATGGHVAGLINCDSHVFKHITTATDTLAVQGVASQIIYVCGWRSRAAGVATWFLENTASANANCSSANTQINGVATEAANTGEVLLSNYWQGLKNTVGNGLCINSTGTGGVDVDVWYAQF